jgi:hypothetical protein
MVGTMHFERRALKKQGSEILGLRCYAAHPSPAAAQKAANDVITNVTRLRATPI